MVWRLAISMNRQAAQSQIVSFRHNCVRLMVNLQYKL